MARTFPVGTAALKTRKTDHRRYRAAKEYDLCDRYRADLFYENICECEKERRQKHRSHAACHEGPVADQTGLEDSFFDLPPQPQSASQPDFFENDLARRYTARPAKNAATTNIKSTDMSWISILPP